MQSKNLQAALQYARDRNFSIIPIRGDKKPYISWSEYQKRRATPEELKKWWGKYPDAMIGIVTGEISGIFVVDCDSREGYEALQKLIPDNLILPVARTPRGGWHLYFLMPKDCKLTVGAGIMPGVDFRAEGGYIIAPPSVNADGKGYTWQGGLSLDEVDLPELPPAISTYINNSIKREGAFLNEDTKRHEATPSDILFVQGRRDDDLFHVANCLIKGGMQEGTARQVLNILADKCKPSFSQKEAQIKIDSVLSRTARQERNISGEVREWALATPSDIEATQIYKELQLATRSDMKAANKALNRMVAENLLERGTRRGSFRVIDSLCEAMDFTSVKNETVDLWLPFNIHDYVVFYPGNLIVLAGEPNSGKTGFLINVIKENMHRFEVHYFNSEMGGSEFNKRLRNLETLHITDWKFKAWERSDNFGDVIKPGKGRLNIIDFLEIHDNFYEVGGKLAEIHKKLKGALAIVAIQKNKGTDTGLGGFRTLEKPRLALAMSPGTLKIVKAKNWKTFENPNGLELEFKLAQGCKFFTDKGWHK